MNIYKTSSCQLLTFFSIALSGCSSPTREPLLSDSTREPLLSNIEQLTIPAMGFDKAGEAYFSPDMQQIIFQAVPTGQQHYQIYVMSLDEREPHMISTGRGECTCAYFHPNGRQVIFASSHLAPDSAPAEDANKSGYRVKDRKYVWNFNPHMDIFEANSDGTNLRRITDASGYDAEGAYNSDGDQIAFTSQRTGDLEIWLMNPDGSEPRQITNAKGYDGGPFISPDGKRIIFRADRRGDDLLQIFVIDIDGQNERQLTKNKDVNWGPYWHPNSKSVVYATSRHGHQNYELYLLNVDTGAEHRVTNTPGFDGLPVFSPNGKKLMWTSKRGPDNTSQIFYADFELPAGF